MKNEIKTMLNEVLESRKTNKQREVVESLPLEVGMVLVFDETSIKPQSRRNDDGTTYKYFDFIAANGTTISEKHLIKSGNGINYDEPNNYGKRLAELLDKVENGLELVITKIVLTPNIFSDSGRTQSYIFEEIVAEDATEDVE